MFIIERLEDQFRTKAETTGRDLTQEARRAWYSHPLTQELVLSLKADMMAMFQQWGSGAHMKATVQETALENAKLLAVYQVTEDMIDKIEEIRDREDESESDENSD